MSEMIERVAWAIGAISDTPWAMTAARTAIEAMREPTEKMLTAGYDTSSASYGAEIGKIWQAMIDAALGKTP